MTPNNNNIPTLRATFDPTNPLEGMFVVSLVEEPAIGSLFFPFAKTPSGEEKINLAILDAPQHKVIGCVLRADYPILRIDGEGKYYNLVFDKETIYELTQHFVKYNNTGNVSVLHNGKPIGGVELTQLFIKDKSKGIDPVGFDEVSDGSLFAEYKILNEEVWKGICNGVYRGFSIEGVFELAPVKIQNANQKVNQENKIDENKFNIFNMSKLRDKLAKMLLKFDSISTDKADLFYDHEGELVVGDEVYTYNEAGDRVPAADGEYLSDNIVYDIENSKVTEIKRFESPDPAKEDLEAMPETPEATPEMPKEDPKVADPKVADPKVAELETKVTELESRVTELISKVEELTAKIETPVVEPIAEVFSAATKRTNDSRATRLAELGSALR